MSCCRISLENIKKIRKMKKMTQLELANKVGVTQSTISKIENDIRNDETPSVRLGLIERIGEVLKVCPLDLMTCVCPAVCKGNCSSCYKKVFLDKNGMSYRKTKED